METSTPERLKVLLCCYACDPGYGSEPGMGWNFAKNIAKFHDTHIIAEEKYRLPLTQYAAEHPEETANMTFHFIVRKRWKRLRRLCPPSYYLTYHMWMKKAYQYALELDKQEDFDLVHMVTISGYREPGLFYKLGKPFIWGPIGGLSDSPWCLLKCLGLKGSLPLATRNIFNGIQKRFGMACRKAATAAHTIFAKTKDDLKDIRNLWGKEAILLNEIGFETQHNKYPRSAHDAQTPLKICWAGVHIPRKALEILIHALQQCKENVELHVLSKGPRTPLYKKLAQKLGVADKITFHGFVSREESFQIMSSSHIFCITSVREDTPTVLYEAFRYALPVIAIDHAGFGAVLDDTCGFKIPIHSFQQVVADYARHIDYLAAHEDERVKLAQGALDMCERYTWDAKMQVINEVYASAVKDKRNNK
ncbi:MAG: glycosyltransferase family 4 protein [Akkermansia sp.]|nr:glycosyltransferase family 4 protein [Akkermansia sp.]